MSPRDAFPGYDEPVNIEGDPEDVLRALLADDPQDEECSTVLTDIGDDQPSE